MYMCYAVGTVYFPILSVILFMASSSRGQRPAWHTKAVDENQRPLKTGSPGYRVVSGNDVTSSKPQGRDVIDDSVTKFVCQSVLWKS